mgnify:CR=1 FL=1
MKISQLFGRLRQAVKRKKVAQKEYRKVKVRDETLKEKCDERHLRELVRNKLKYDKRFAWTVQG